MNSQTPTPGKASWLGQFVLYLILFAGIVLGIAYFWMGPEQPARPQPAAAQPQATASPSVMPAGQSGHDAPK